MQRFIIKLAHVALRVLAVLTAAVGLAVALLIRRPETVAGLLYAALIGAGVAGVTLLLGALVCGLAAGRRARHEQHA